MTTKQYQNIYEINEFYKDEIERLAWSVCELFNLSHDEVNEMRPKTFAKKVIKLNKSLQRSDKKFWYVRSLETDVKKLTFGQFIEVQHWLKKPPVEVLHLIAATLNRSKNKNHKKLAAKYLNVSVRYILSDCLAFVTSLKNLMLEYKGVFGEQFTELEQDAKPEKPHPFIELYGWIYSATQIAEHLKITLHEAYKLNLVECLNTLAFLKSKIDYEKKLMK